MMREWFWYHANNIYTLVIAVPVYIICVITNMHDAANDWVDKRRNK